MPSKDHVKMFGTMRELALVRFRAERVGKSHSQYLRDLAIKEITLAEANGEMVDAKALLEALEMSEREKKRVVLSNRPEMPQAFDSIMNAPRFPEPPKAPMILSRPLPKPISVMDLLKLQETPTIEAPEDDNEVG